jgi:AraC-like DNA-binding protein
MAVAGIGNANKRASRWPEGLLRAQPVRQVYVCGRQLRPPGLGHAVNFPRLELVLGGCYENLLEANNRAVTVRLTAGAALFAAPNCWNVPTWRHPVRLLSLLFGQKQIDLSLVTRAGAARPRVTARKFSLPRPLTGPLPKVLDAMVEVQLAGGPVAALPDLARALLSCVQEAMQQPDRPAVSPAKSLLEAACAFLQRQHQYDITRQSVARHFSVSPNYLSRVFQDQGRMTFRSYLMQVRTEHAKHLLRSQDLKLDEVAVRCGYRDTAYFCRVFKRLARMTAAHYRAAHKPAAAATAPQGGVSELAVPCAASRKR